MRVHSDILTTDHVIDALNDAKAKGHVDVTVGIDVLTRHGSRKRKGALEVQIGASTAQSFISQPVREYLEGWNVDPATIRRASRRRPRQGKAQSAGDHLASAATWHEWGHFIAELFRVDPRAIVGQYEGESDFRLSTYNLAPDYAPEHNGRQFDFMHQ